MEGPGSSPPPPFTECDLWTGALNFSTLVSSPVEIISPKISARLNVIAKSHSEVCLAHSIKILHKCLGHEDTTLFLLPCEMLTVPS